MNFDLKEKSGDREKVVVTLALLDTDIQKMMLHYTKNQCEFEMSNSNNLQLHIPKDSHHQLFYLAH